MNYSYWLFDPCRILAAPSARDCGRAPEETYQYPPRWRKWPAVNLSATLLLLFMSCYTLFCSANPQVITYPKAESSSDSRASYPVALLNLCARQSANRITFKPARVNSQQDRSIRLLSQNQEIDLLWAVTTEAREEQLLPIRIPIDRGLIGWRLLLVRQQDQHLFENIDKAVELGRLLAGQGHDWPDVAVLKANGFKVSTSTTYEGLFQMLARGHIQYFPRSVAEIWPELEARADLQLTIEDHLIIHYPEALYFFVNKNNQTLADTLTQCLQTATRDGSLRELFYQYYGESIAKANLPGRTIITLPNPLLPTLAPALSSGYWFTPAEVE